METFEELGTAGAVAKLYEGSGFNRCSEPYFECGDGYVTSASSVMLEGIDFDLTYFPLKHLGYKSVVGPTGQLMAVISNPRTLKVVMGVSSKLDFKEISQIWDGVVSAAKEFGYQQLALELNPSLTGLSIAVSATGYEDKSYRRPIAKSMDLICISNNAGAAFLGSQILQKRMDLEKYKQLVGAYLKPELSPYTLNALRESEISPSFGYFCRHSLSATLKRLCEDSGLGAKIYLDKLPFAGGSIDAAKELGVDPMQAALKGGEDYCLLYTIPIGSHERFRHDFQNWDIIGHLAKPEVGAVIVSPDGLEHAL